MRGANGELGKEVRHFDCTCIDHLNCKMLTLQRISTSRRYGARVQFLMVCVDGARVALEFGRMFDLKAVVNCYIPSRGYMPVG